MLLALHMGLAVITVYPKLQCPGSSSGRAEAFPEQDRHHPLTNLVLNNARTSPGPVPTTPSEDDRDFWEGLVPSYA